MPLNLKITAETEEPGTFRAVGMVTAPDGTAKGKAEVFLRKGKDGTAQLVLPADTKSTILGNVVVEYKSYEGPGADSTPELAKGAKLTFSNLNFAI